MTNKRAIKILKSLKGEARLMYKAELKGVFGSLARNEQNRNSDVDILVEFLPGATLFDLSGLGIFLEEKLKSKVDLVSQNAIRDELKHNIYNELVSI